MDNLQLTTRALPQTNAKDAAAKDAAASGAACDPQPGFQTLLQRLMGLESAADATATTPPEMALAARETDGAVQTAAELPGTAPVVLLLAPPAAALHLLPDALERSAPGVASGRTALTASDPDAAMATLTGENIPRELREHILRKQPGQSLDLHPGHTLAAPPGHALESSPGHTLESSPGHTLESSLGQPPSAGLHDAAVAGLQPAPYAQGLPAAPAAREPAATPAAIDKPITAPGWDTELAQKVVWLSGEKQHVAELHINPPHLGPLHIKLALDEHQTSAVFTSPHSAVREALENALPRLREVLAENGITLGHASVSADSARDGRAFEQPRQPSGSSAGGADATAAAAATHGVARLRGQGLVDLFA